jgi:hypothetical protein
MIAILYSQSAVCKNSIHNIVTIYCIKNIKYCGHVTKHLKEKIVIVRLGES